jgi:hypothetical protein
MKKKVTLLFILGITAFTGMGLYKIPTVDQAPGSAGVTAEPVPAQTATTSSEPTPLSQLSDAELMRPSS